MRHEVFKDGFLAQTQLRTHRLRWYHRHEFAMMLTSVGFREVTVKYRSSPASRETPRRNGFLSLSARHLHAGFNAPNPGLELTAPQQSARATFPILANSRD